MKRGLAGLAVGCFCVLGLFIIIIASVFVNLPDVTELKRCITTRLYHVYLCPNSADFTPFNKISPNIVGAVIMSEDASFYSHDGVDLNEMKEAAIKDINEHRYARGASTITQQLAKNVFLTKDKNMMRKLEEIYLALQIEKHFSKTKILTFYLNVVEFGKNIYGVKAACRHYFHKTPEEVTPEEGAFLAFLLPNPKKYSQSFSKGHLTPFANKMVKTILHRMALSHRITEEEYASALARVPLFPWLGAPTEVTSQPPGLPGQPPTQPSDIVDSPTGVVEDQNAGQLAPDETPDVSDESDQRDNDFQFDFNPDDTSDK